MEEVWNVKYAELMNGHGFLGETSPRAADVECFGIAKLDFFGVRASGGAVL